MPLAVLCPRYPRNAFHALAMGVGSAEVELDASGAASQSVLVPTDGPSWVRFLVLVSDDLGGSRETRSSFLFGVLAITDLVVATMPGFCQLDLNIRRGVA